MKSMCVFVFNDNSGCRFSQQPGLPEGKLEGVGLSATGCESDCKSLGSHYHLKVMGPMSLLFVACSIC